MSDTEIGRRAPGVYWMGDIPAKCHICEGRIRKTFIDGRTKRGWMSMDQKCHRIFGYGFGVGNGQRYELEEDTRRWLKVEG